MNFRHSLGGRQRQRDSTSSNRRPQRQWAGGNGAGGCPPPNPRWKQIERCTWPSLAISQKMKHLPMCRVLHWEKVPCTYALIKMSFSTHNKKCYVYKWKLWILVTKNWDPGPLQYFGHSGWVFPSDWRLFECVGVGWPGGVGAPLKQRNGAKKYTERQGKTFAYSARNANQPFPLACGKCTSSALAGGSEWVR